jgi:hypothetical protein
VASASRLLDQAETLNELVMLEGELAKREADLASLEAKKRRLADRDSAVHDHGDVARAGREDPRRGTANRLRGRCQGSWSAFVASLEILLTVLGALLPWLVLLGGPIVALVWLLRRLGRRAARSGAFVPGTTAPAPAASDPAAPASAPARMVPPEPTAAPAPSSPDAATPRSP